MTILFSSYNKSFLSKSLSFNYIFKRFYPGSNDIMKINTIINGIRTLTLTSSIVSPNTTLILASYPRTTTVLGNPIIYSRKSNHFKPEIEHALEKFPPFDPINIFKRPKLVSETENNKLEKPAINFKPILEYAQKKTELQQDKEETKKQFDALIAECKKEGYIFQSKIVDEISIYNLKFHELLFELYQRNLIKLDNKTAVLLTAENGEKIIIGSYPYDVKITQQGIALNKSLQIQQTLIDVNFEVSDKNPPQLILAVVIPDNSQTIIPSGNTTHINIVEKIREEVCIYDIKMQVYRAVGYLTSQKNPNVLCEKEQFKNFQEEKEIENKKVFSVEKSQYFIAYEHSKIIASNLNIKILAGGSQYLMQNCNLEYVYKVYALQANKQSELMNHIGYTRKDLENILQRFLYNEENNIPQPKTEMQLIKEKEGKLKQKEKQMKAKSEKDKKPIQLPKDSNINESEII